MVDKTQNHMVYYILKIGRMQTSDKWLPLCTYDESLKKICSYDQSWNGLLIAYILGYFE